MSESPPTGARAARTAAFLDVGTNSIRVVVVHVQPNGAVRILTQQKEVVRLAQGEFADGYLREDAMERARAVCGRFVELARSFGAEEIQAVATAATREARNQAELLHRLRESSGIDVHVVSGLEEARLIYLGVSRGVHLEGEPALFVDIGGGSTELIVGDARDHRVLASVKLGAVRLADLFFLPQEEAPVAPARYALLRRYAANALVRSVQLIGAHEIHDAFGSSGTIQNVADIAFEALEGRRRQRDDLLSREAVDEVVALLCARSLADRRRLPGINPERADIIVAGAAILQEIMHALDVRAVHVSDRGLREGLVVDYLARAFPDDPEQGYSVRDRSVLQLARACGFDEAHARHVMDLALQLYDSACDVGLLDATADLRDLLRHAAMLHDVGSFLSYTNHHRHSYYLVRNSDLLGFDQVEIAAIACIARFHRRGYPRRNRPELEEVDAEAREGVRLLATLLRLAEKLDRGRVRSVGAARFVSASRGGVELLLEARGNAELEAWGIASEAPVFERAFKRSLRVRVSPPQGTDGGGAP